MAVLVDPRTGDQYDASNPPPGFDPNEYGLVSPEEYARQQQAQKEGALGAAARAAIKPIAAAGQAIQGALPGSVNTALGASPEDIAAAKPAEQQFFEQAQADAAAHPVAAFAGETIPYSLLGGSAAGAGEALATRAGLSPLLGAGTGLLSESAAVGASQEAVDAVADPQKRDFSWRAALMNGGLNMLFGAAFHGAGKLLGGEAGAVGGRNILAELDPGEVPEAVPGGTRGRAAPGEPRPAMSGGAAAANFDELTASKAIDELNTGKVSPGPLAEAAPAIRQQLSEEGARDLNFIQDVLDHDAGLAAKNSDFAQGAAEWTPQMVERQNQWLGSLTEETAKAMEAIDALPDAKGMGRAAKEALEKGMRDLTGTEGAERNVDIDAFKRNLQKQVMKTWSPANAAIDGATREAVARELQGVAETVRQGLLDEDMFGRNAAVQAAHNEPLHEMIDALGRVQKKLYETTGRSYEDGMMERRADPDALRRVFEDPHLGGSLFQQDLAHVLDQAETLGRNRLEHGLSRLERLPEFVDKIQGLRDDLNTAQVLQVAEDKAGGGHGMGGASAAAQVASVVGGKGLEMAVPGFGNVIRRNLEPRMARGLDRVAKMFGLGGDLAKEGTATRSLLDRYANRVKGSELLQDSLHRSRMPEALRNFLDQAHAPPAPPVPGAPGGPGTGQGGNGPPMAPGAPGSPANDVAGKVAALAAVGGAGALLAPATASAAELGPDGQTLSPQQAAARAALRAQMQGLDPSEQAQQIRTAEAFARIGKQVEQRTTAAVTDLFRVAKDPNAPPRFQSPEARQLSARAEDLGTTRSMARFMGKNVDDPVQAWREKSDQLGKLVSDPSGLASAMAAHLGDLPRLQPEMYTAMVSRTMQAAEYLFDKLPAPVGKTPLMPNGYPPSLEDIQSFAGHWAGTLHPLDALDDLAANDLVPEQMQAVKEFWPESYELFRQNALSQIYQLGQKRGPLPLVALQQLDGALDLDGAGQPALSGEMAALITQATQQAAAQGKPPPSPSPAQANSQAPARIASSALGSIHGDAGA